MGTEDLELLGRLHRDGRIATAYTVNGELHLTSPDPHQVADQLRAAGIPVAVTRTSRWSQRDLQRGREAVIAAAVLPEVMAFGEETTASGDVELTVTAVAGTPELLDLMSSLPEGLVRIIVQP